MLKHFAQEAEVCEIYTELLCVLLCLMGTSLHCFICVGQSELRACSKVLSRGKYNVVVSQPIAEQTDCRYEGVSFPYLEISEKQERC